MVDEIENKNSDSDLEADFPSFLRSDNPENQEHDINHFLEDDTSAESQAEVPQTLSRWNDGFDEADKADGSADWDLDLGDINAPIDNLNLEDNADINQPLYDESAVSEVMESTTAEPVADLPEAVSAPLATEQPDTDMPDDSEIGEAEISAAMEDEQVVEDTGSNSGINFLNEDKDTSSPTETKIPNPEDYMSFDIPLEELARSENAATPAQEEIPESEFIAQHANVNLHDMPKETFVEDSDQPYVEVLPGNQNMNPDEYMSYDLPESALGATQPKITPEVSQPKSPTNTPENSASQAETVTTSLSTSKVEQAEKETLQMFKWYSGHIDDKYYRFSAEAPSGEFKGTAEQNSIYVDIGTSAYGWNVTFDNGISMNLADVKEFQLRNGRLPCADGVITYGATGLKFSQVERIVVGSIPEYFHYGYQS